MIPESRSGGAATPPNSKTASFTYTMNLSKIVLPLAFALMFAQSTLAQIPPQGRLSIDQYNPVQLQDQNAVFPSIYYEPYIGANIPINTGSGLAEYTFSTLTLTFSSTYNTGPKIYDVFVFIPSSSGSVTIGFGPAWSSSTSGLISRNLLANGHGGNTYGIITNSAALILNNGSTTYNIPAGQATYVGSVYMIGTAETSMVLNPAPAPGGFPNGNVIGIYNAYNRVKATAISRDSNTTWSYGAASWRNLDNSANNSITWLDGLGDTFVKTSLNTSVTFGATGGSYVFGVALTSAGATAPDLTPIIAGSASTTQNITALESFYPVMGLNTLTAMELSNSGTQTIYGHYVESLQWDGEF